MGGRRVRSMSRHLAAGLVVCAILGMACGGSSPQAQPPEDRPNVVVALIDTFRPDHLGVNGYGRRTAPFLEGLIERSTVFERAFSTSSWTAPATSSLFTGLYPVRHGVTEGFVAHKNRSAALEDLVGEKIALNRLPAGVATLAELLKGSGYATFGVATNINIGSEIGFDRGFDRFSRIRDGSGEQVAQTLHGWRSEIDAAQPYFIYLHFNDVHKPYEPRNPWYEETGDELARLISAYDSEISYLDGVLEGLYHDFEWRRGTLFVGASDHGEEFGEHGQFGHRFSLYDELLRVLLMISGEDLGIPARRITTPVSLVDALPTILDLVGVEQPRDRDGNSLARFLDGGVPSEVARDFATRTLFAHRVQRNPREALEEHLWAAFRMPWKLIASPDGALRLYDLEQDPGELVDLASAQSRYVVGLEAELEAFRNRARVVSEQVVVEMDQQTLETLESLGYVQ